MNGRRIGCWHCLCGCAVWCARCYEILSRRLSIWIESSVFPLNFSEFYASVCADFSSLPLLFNGSNVCNVMSGWPWQLLELPLRSLGQCGAIVLEIPPETKLHICSFDAKANTMRIKLPIFGWMCLDLIILHVFCYYCTGQWIFSVRNLSTPATATANTNGINFWSFLWWPCGAQYCPAGLRKNWERNEEVVSHYIKAYDVLRAPFTKRNSNEYLCDENIFIGCDKIHSGTSANTHKRMKWNNLNRRMNEHFTLSCCCCRLVAIHRTHTLSLAEHPKNSRCECVIIAMYDDVDVEDTVGGRWRCVIVGVTQWW